MKQTGGIARAHSHSEHCTVDLRRTDGGECVQPSPISLSFVRSLRRWPRLKPLAASSPQYSGSRRSMAARQRASSKPSASKSPAKCPSPHAPNSSAVGVEAPREAEAGEAAAGPGALPWGGPGGGAAGSTAAAAKISAIVWVAGAAGGGIRSGWVALLMGGAPPSVPLSWPRLGHGDRQKGLAPEVGPTTEPARWVGWAGG
mmetsp:Transcript_71258/g.161212  ORF Transcript_71258/g.161212 Transcript_71258/m.161212 type:complete len:201 (+) Transcript_71258:182-784(+)